ncbi:MAG TPA: hypothetical protein VF808_03335 [Ktedonobacterales bacterium]
MTDGKASGKAPEGAPASQPRALLSAVIVGVNGLTSALDEVGLHQQLRESPACRLRLLDRSLPDETLDDLLLGCEAFAAVTGPSALATEDQNTLRAEAQRYLRVVRAVADAARGRRRPTLIGMTASGTQNSFLRMGLSEPRVRDALAELAGALEALAALATSGTPRKRTRLIPLGVGCFIPATVLGGAAALIIVLLASIALATGQAAVTPSGLDIPLTSALPTATPLPTATAKPASTPTTRPGNPSPTTPPGGSNPTPTPKPGAKPTPTSRPGSGTLTVSPNPIDACASPTSNQTFTISYSGSQSSIKWTASWSSSNITLNNNNSGALSGTLSSSQPVPVTLSTTNDSDGSITIIGSDGSSATESYTSINC